MQRYPPCMGPVKRRFGRLRLGLLLAALTGAALCVFLLARREDGSRAVVPAAEPPGQRQTTPASLPAGTDSRRPGGVAVGADTGPEQQADPLTIPLEVSKPEQLTGRVTNEAGEPLAARVSLQFRRVETDPATGLFALDLAGLAPLDDPLVVTARGYAPAVLREVGQAFVDAGRSHPPLAVVLVPAGRVAGVVRRHDGAPAPGLVVSVREAVPDDDGLAEASASSRGALLIETDPEGAFDFDGLRRAPYTVVAADPVTLEWAERGVVPDAQGIELRLSAPALRDVVGVARFPDGTPANSRTISACVLLPGSALEPHRLTRSALTDEEGVFLLEGLPRQDLSLFAGHEVDPWSFALPAETTRIDLVLQRLCPVALVWSSADPAPDAARALAAGGEELGLYQRRWGALRPQRRLDFSVARGEEPTAALLVPENTAALELERGGKPLMRVPLAPRFDVKTLVRP